MRKRPIPEDSAKVKTSPGLRLLADPPERDARGRILTPSQAKEAERLRMTAAERARLAAAAAMLPSHAAPPAAARVTRDSKGDRAADFEAPGPAPRKR